MTTQNGLEAPYNSPNQKGRGAANGPAQVPGVQSVPTFAPVVWDASPDFPSVPVAAEEIRDFIKTAMAEAGRKSVMGHLQPGKEGVTVTVLTRAGQILDRRLFGLTEIPCTSDGLRRMIAAIIPVISRLPLRGGKVNGAPRSVLPKPSAPPVLTLIKGDKT